MPDRPYNAGENAPVTGLYQIIHDPFLPAGQRHRPAHLVVIIEGELLLPCKRCGQAVSYRLVAEGVHLLHDWDFTAPPELLMPSRPGEERRSLPRCRVDIPLSLRARHLPAPYAGRLYDLSEAGLSATVPADLSVDDLVSLEFKLPGSPQPCRLGARLRYRRGGRYGFQFAGQTSVQRERIRSFCRPRSS